MRHVDFCSAAQLGLTAEEIAFLLPAAEARFDAFAKQTNYNLKDALYGSKHFSNHISSFKGAGGDALEAINGATLHALIYGTGEAENPPETLLDDQGYGLQHSSYGAVSVGTPSGMTDFLVGSAALSQYAKTINFNFAEIYCSSGDQLAVHAHAKRQVELTLSSEQFIMMVRGDAGFKTPCGLQIRDGSRADSPPSTNYDNHDAEDFKAQIDALTVPLSKLIHEICELVSAGASKKSEYDAMIELSKQAATEYAKIAPAILEIGNAKGAAEGKRAHHQFVTEMNERLGQLNIGQSISQLLGLSKD